MSAPLEALSILEQSRDAKEQQLHAVQNLGAYMLQTLQTRGELIVARWGLYGGTPGIIGSARPGQRLTQSTIPVLLGNGQSIALRHPLRQRNNRMPSTRVELVKTPATGPDYCVEKPKPSGLYAPGSSMEKHESEKGITYKEDQVIAEYNGNLKPSESVAGLIGSVSLIDFSSEELAATRTLVGHIESSLKPINKEWQAVVTTLPDLQHISMPHVREGTNHIQDLDAAVFGSYTWASTYQD